MSPNQDELTQHSTKDDSQGVDDSDQGFELDKLDIQKNPEDPKPDGAAQNEAPVSSKVESDNEIKLKPDTVPVKKPTSNLYRMIIMGCFAILILVLFGSFAFKMMRSPARETKVNEAEATTYLEIDPIVTNLGHDSRINIVVAIRFNPNKQPEFLIFQSKVKDTIVSYLVSPELRNYIGDKGIKINEVYIYDELIKRLQDAYGNRVVIRELRTS